MKINITFQDREVNIEQVKYLKHINKIIREDSFAPNSLGIDILLDFIEEAIPTKYFNTF